MQMSHENLQIMLLIAFGALVVYLAIHWAIRDAERKRRRMTVRDIHVMLKETYSDSIELAPERGSCRACRFWDTSVQLSDHDVETGQCRADTPIWDDRGGCGRWPFTEEEDWCRAFERDPELVRPPDE